MSGPAGGWRPARIVSGGQTGADRAALDAALELGLATGGWVPRGRAAEDGPLPARYAGLAETGSDDPAVRTARNVRDADATLIVSHGPLAGGSAATRERAREQGRPWLHLDLATVPEETAAERLRAWLDALRPRRLNVAGPRASEDPAIYDAVRGLLRGALARP